MATVTTSPVQFKIC